MKEKTEDNSEISILLIAPFGRGAGVAMHTEALCSELEKRGIKVIKASTQVSKNKLIKAILQPIKITSFAVKKRNEYSLISVQLASYWGFMPGLLSIFVARMINKKVACSYFGGDYKDFIRKHRFVFGIVLRESCFFTVPSTRIKRHIDRIFPDEKNKTKVLNPLYDDSFFKHGEQEKARELLKQDKEKKIILNVANLYAVKGQKYLIEAMKEVHNRLPDVLCYIVGEGPERKNLEALIESLHLEDVVILSGRKPHDEILLWMNAADLFVLPSLKESFGIVQTEALACGKPVVATRTEGGEEVITDERVGILVPPADSKALAEAIFRALDTKWDTEHILNHAKHFSSENIINRTIEVYSSCIARKRGM